MYKFYKKKKKNILPKLVNWQWLDEEPNQEQGIKPNT